MGVETMRSQEKEEGRGEKGERGGKGRVRDRLC